MKSRILTLLILLTFFAGQAVSVQAGTIPPYQADEVTPEETLDQPTNPDWYRLPTSAFTASQESLPALGIQGTAAGFSHTCALTTEGGVKCWGDNWEGKLGNGSVVNSYTPVDVTGLSAGVIDISGTHKHTCALTDTGEVKCWGRNWHGELGDGTTDYRVEPVTPQGLSSGVIAIAAGGFHTCALIYDGSIRCWGANWHGEVGDGTNVEQHTPVEVVELGGKAVAIAAGKYHTCAILETGGLRCWGYNKFGQLGNGPDEDKWIPTKVAGLNANVTAVVLGENHSCALLADHRVDCWGLNDQGQLGIGSTELQYVPTFVTGMGVNAGSIFAGQRFTCAFALTGGIYCWGENWAGQLGDGSQTNQLVPTAVSGMDAAATDLSAGDSHACAVLETGGVKCWGSNSHGQLGNEQAAMRTKPADVYGLTTGFISAVSGGSHSCALSEAGGVYCWGSNQYGQLGDGTTTYRTSPVQVYGLSQGVREIAAGGNHTCARTDSQVLCWGNNSYGQLGNSTRIDSQVPVVTAGINHPPIRITTGTNHSCAVQDNGVIKCWGYNKNGQLGNGTRDDMIKATALDGVDGIDFTAVAGGDRHTCAITNSGEVMCWGLNEDGQLGNGSLEISTIPVEVSGLVQKANQVALGSFHSCVLLEDGSIRCWGNNLYGQLGDGTTYDAWIPISTYGLGGKASSLSASGYQSCATLADSQTVQCWGYNQSGQLGDGTTITRMLPVYVVGLNASTIGAGSQTTCAVTLWGGVKCWGLNAQGQVGDGSLPWSLLPQLVKNLVAASLQVNYASGVPGSYFTISGSNFEGNSGVYIRVNNLSINSISTTDSNGSLLFVLDSSLAEPGGYVISIAAGQTRNVLFHLDESAPVRPIEDEGEIYQIPGGIALTWRAYLPWGAK
jgi:alpha-tubulin suppressor-like RCC1 family protein